MPTYLNIETKEYPRHNGDLELLGWTVGEPLPTNWVEIEEIEMPIVGEYQAVEPGFPLEVNGVWKQQWSIRDLTEDEILQLNTPYPIIGSGSYSWNSETKQWDDLRKVKEPENKE